MAMGLEPPEDRRTGGDRRKKARRRFDHWYTSLYMHLPALFTLVFALLLTVIAVVAVLSVSVLRTVEETESAANRANAAAVTAHTNTQRLRRAALGACERIQRLRDDVNAQANNQYDVIQAAAAVAQTREARTLYANFLKATPYSPPTDCQRAVDQPLTYKPPPLVSFAQVDKCYEPPKNVRIGMPCP
jgi:hypothetical protein